MLIPFKELFRPGDAKVDCVLHLGANTGQEAKAYQELGVKRVIWVEAIPDVYCELLEHLKSFPGQEALCACVSDEDGKQAAFHIASNEGQSSSLLEFGTHSQEHPSVKFTGDIQLDTIRVDTLLKGVEFNKEETWMLNMDLQGAEMLALKGMGEVLLWKFSCVYIEVNERHLYKGCPLVHEIDEYLVRFGFTPAETKMTNFGWGDRFYRRFAYPQ